MQNHKTTDISKTNTWKPNFSQRERSMKVIPQRKQSCVSKSLERNHYESKLQFNPENNKKETIMQRTKLITIRNKIDIFYKKYLEEKGTVKQFPLTKPVTPIIFDWRVRFLEMLSKEGILDIKDNYKIVPKCQYLSEKILKISKFWILLVESKKKILQLEYLVEIFKQGFSLTEEVDILKDFYFQTIRKVNKKTFNEVLSKIYKCEMNVNEKFHDFFAISLLDGKPVKDLSIINQNKLSPIIKSYQDSGKTQKNLSCSKNYQISALSIDNPKNFEIISPFQNKFSKLGLSSSHKKSFSLNEITNFEFNGNGKNLEEETDNWNVNINKIVIDENKPELEDIKWETSENLDLKNNDEIIKNEEIVKSHLLSELTNQPFNFEENKLLIRDEKEYKIIADDQHINREIISEKENNIHNNYEILKGNFEKEKTAEEIVPDIIEEQEDFQDKEIGKTEQKTVSNQEKLKNKKRKNIMGLFENDIPVNMEGGSLIFPEIITPDSEITMNSEDLVNKYFSEVFYSIIMTRKSARLINKKSLNK
jgi:hypothetical protein